MLKVSEQRNEGEIKYILLCQNAHKADMERSLFLYYRRSEMQVHTI